MKFPKLIGLTAAFGLTSACLFRHEREIVVEQGDNGPDKTVIEQTAVNEGGATFISVTHNDAGAGGVAHAHAAVSQSQSQSSRAQADASAVIKFDAGKTDAGMGGDAGRHDAGCDAGHDAGDAAAKPSKATKPKTPAGP